MGEELIRRMEKLEKESQRLKVISFLVLLTLSAILFIGANKWDKEIVTESLKVVDGKGNTKIALLTDTEGVPRISLFDSGQKLRLGIMISEDGTLKINLFDPGEKQRLAMGVTEDGAPGISLFDSKGKLGLGMGATEDGDPFLLFLGPDGEVICSLP